MATKIPQEDCPQPEEDPLDKPLSGLDIIYITSTIGSEITPEEMKEFRASLDKKAQAIFDNSNELMQKGIIAAGKLTEREKKAIEGVKISQIPGIHQIQTCIRMRIGLLNGIQNHQSVPRRNGRELEANT